MKINTKRDRWIKSVSNLPPLSGLVIGLAIFVLSCCEKATALPPPDQLKKTEMNGNNQGLSSKNMTKLHNSDLANSVLLAQMDRLRIACIQYYAQHGRFPSETMDPWEIIQQYGPPDEIDRKYFIRKHDEKEMFVDWWGTPVRYLVDGDNIWIYSEGPNRKSERGDGDDICITFSLAPNSSTEHLRKATTEIIFRVEAYLMILKREEETLPKDAPDLVNHYCEYKRLDHLEKRFTRTINGERYFVDAWGNPLVYQSGSVYSVGPNGIDERGEGDDVR